MKDRIKQLMEAQHMNQQTFATFTGIGTASLSSIFTGRTRPTLNHVDAILEKFPNVNPIWLLKGVGGMLLTSDDNATQDDSPQTVLATPSAPQTGTEGTLFDTANMAEANTSANYQNARYQNNGSPNNANRNSPQGFHFDTEQKVVQVTRKITEIRVFYDDQTWESFVPKKDK